MGSGTFSVTPPAGAAGFIAIIQTTGGLNQTPTVTPPAGFTVLINGDNPNNSTDNWSWRVVCIGSESAGTNWTVSDVPADGGTSLTMAGYSGPITIHKSATQDSTQGDPSSLNSPSVTTTEPALIVRAMTNQFDSLPSNFYPTNATLGRNTHFTRGSGNSHGHLTAIAHSTQAVAGSTGVATWDFSNGAQWYPSAFTFAITTPGAPAGSTGRIKVHTGSSFEPKPVKVWTGSAWETKPLKYWDGTQWVETPY